MYRDDVKAPLLYFFLSLIPLSLALYGTVTGTAVLKRSREERAKDPVRYWFLLAFEYGIFVLLIALAISN